jgi:hypothetical protein
MAMKLKTKNQRQAPQAIYFPLPDAPNVEAILRHFHRFAIGAARCGSFVGKDFSIFAVCYA